MSEIATRQYKPLRDYLDRVPGHRRGTRCHLATGIRWCTKGIRNSAGAVVKLRAIRFGVRWMTTDEWFAEFLAAFDTLPAPEPVEPPTPAARRNAQTAASAELDALGVK